MSRYLHFRAVLTVEYSVYLPCRWHATDRPVQTNAFHQTREGVVMREVNGYTWPEKSRASALVQARQARPLSIR